MNDEPEREAFEAKMRKRHYDLYRAEQDSVTNLIGDYVDEETRKHWITWQASRADMLADLKMMAEALRLKMQPFSSTDKDEYIEQTCKDVLSRYEQKYGGKE